MNFVTDYKLENYILNTHWDDLPQKIKDRALVCSIDLFMALILGSKGKQFEAGKRLVEKNMKDGTIQIIGSEKSYNLVGATCALAHASNSFDIDDGHNLIKGHPGTSFIAGLLSAGIEKDITYREFLTSIVIAYEVTIRWALAEQSHYDYLHSSGTYGAFGTAASIGRIYGLSKHQLNTALSIADFHAPLTPVMRSVEYPSTNKDGVPFGALVGVMAVEETLSGITGYGNLLEAEEYKHYVETLGNQFEIMNLYFKPYTCCRWAHQPISACLDLMQEYKFEAKDIASVYVHTFEAAARLSKKVPLTTDEAQYNIAYPIAAALVHKELGYLQVREEALSNEEVIHMMGKLNFVVDEELERQFPKKRLASVKIVLVDGRELQSPVYSAPGEADENVDLAWITEKFNRITKPILNDTDQKKVLAELNGDLSIPLRSLVELINKCIKS